MSGMAFGKLLFTEEIMRIRPYIESKDYKYLKRWIDNEKIHALWCGNLISYPITKDISKDVSRIKMNYGADVI